MNKEEMQDIKNTIQMLYYVVKTYDCGITKDDIDKLDNLQSQLDIANNKLKKVKEYFKEELEKLNNYYAQDEINEALQKEFKKLQSIIGSD